MRRIQKRLPTIALLVASMVCPCVAQGVSADDSHRYLERAGMDVSGAQLRLELLQRLAAMARARQAKGLPPIDPNRLSPEIRRKIQEVQQSDKELRARLLQAQIDRERRARQRANDPSAAQPDGTGPVPPTPTQQRLMQQLLKPFTGDRNKTPDNSNNSGINRPRNDPRRPSGNELPEWPNSGLDPSDVATGRRPSRGSGGQTPLTPSQRPLDGDFENFDLADWIDRLSKSRPPRQSPSASSTTQRTKSSGRPPRTQNPARGTSKTGSPRRSDQSKAKFSKGTFKDLMKNAKAQGRAPRREARGATSSDKSGDSGLGVFAGAFEKTAEGLGQHVDDIIRHQQQRRRDGRSRSSTNRSRQQTSGFFKGLNRVNRRTTQFFSRQSRAAAAPSSVRLPSAPSIGSLVPFLFVVLVIGVVWFLLRREPEPALATEAGAIVQSRMPVTINGRQDVIDAFHYIAARTPAVKGNWWTHSRVARALAKVLPSRNSTAIQDLARVYETARYLPPDAELSHADLESARKAVERCTH